MDNIFSRISELANQAGLSSRYKFMLLDLKDLRSKDWVPRRAAAGPQTLEAVKKEVDKESRFTDKVFFFKVSRLVLIYLCVCGYVCCVERESARARARQRE
jgi:hypothetical protein